MDFIPEVNILTVGLALLTLFLVALCFSNWHFIKPDYPPGPYALPVIGNLHLIAGKNTYQVVQGLHKRYGNVIRFQMGGEAVFFINGYDYIHKALVEDGDGWANAERPSWQFGARTLFQPPGIIFTNGDSYKKARAFVFGGLQLNSVQENVQMLMREEFEEFYALFTAKPDDTKEHTLSTVMNIVSMFTIGKRFSRGDPLLKEVTHKIKFLSVMSIPENWLHFLQYFTRSRINKTHSVIAEQKQLVLEAIEDHRSSFNKDKPRDLVDMFLAQEGNTGVTKEEFLSIVTELFYGARESFHLLILVIISYLLKFPEMQLKCREETRKLCPKNDWITFEDRHKTPFLNNFIREVFRIATPVTYSIFRTNNKSFTIGGYRIPEKSICMYDLFSPHIDPTLWENPTEFNPNRWNEGVNDQNKGMITFGLGPRTCPGEISVNTGIYLLFANMINRYEMLTDRHPSEIERVWDIAFLGISPFKLQLKPV